ncbi:Auxin transport protein [Vigna angularis]|uniref:Auxin transport protein n=1 Tax=Phaseolus angularis TaxID=3914 RepID=A0A8T0L0Q0_PHAAN|nr:Auxin transport protein [Vigna angularis]
MWEIHQQVTYHLAFLFSKRVVKLDEGMRSWYDIPFTVAESLLADEEFTISVGPTFNGSTLPRIDSLEVYGRAKMYLSRLSSLCYAVYGKICLLSNELTGKCILTRVSVAQYEKDLLSGYRSRHNQCVGPRWKIPLCPEKKGSFTQEKDIHLAVAVMLFGYSLDPSLKWGG